MEDESRVYEVETTETEEETTEKGSGNGLGFMAIGAAIVGAGFLAAKVVKTVVKKHKAKKEAEAEGEAEVVEAEAEIAESEESE